MTPHQSDIGSRKNLLNNSLWILVSRILTVVVSFLSIPFVVAKLGISGYGTWESIIAVSAICNIFQAIISGTLLWMISNSYGVRDYETIRRYVRMGAGLSMLLFFIVTPLAFLGRKLLVELFRVPPEFAQTAAWIFPCVVGLMVLGGINEVMGALIGGFQRAGATTFVQALAVTSNNVIVILCLLWGMGFWSLLIGFVLGFLISSIGLYVVARKLFDQLSLSPLLPARSVLVKVAPYAGFMLLGGVSLGLRDQTDKIILSSVASTDWTGYYGIAARLAGIVMIVCTFFYVPTIAASGAMHARGAFKEIGNLYEDVVSIMVCLVGLCVVLIGGMHDRIIMLWIGRPMPEVTPILYLLLFGNTSAVLLTGIGSSICKGMGIIRMETIYIVIGLLLNIALKFSLVPLIGPIGTVAASSISWSVSSVVFVILLHKRVQLPLNATIKAVKTIGIIGVCISVSRYAESSDSLAGMDKLSILVSSIKIGFILTVIFLNLMIFSNTLPWKSVVKATQLLKNKLTSRLARYTHV